MHGACTKNTFFSICILATDGNPGAIGGGKGKGMGGGRRNYINNNKTYNLYSVQRH